MKKSDKITRVAYIIEAGFEYFISLFVTSTMLGYILDMLGFSDALQGIISTVATFTYGAQLFAFLLNGRRKKRIVTVGHFINQACFVILYLLPIFNIPATVKPFLLMALLFTGHIINNAINPSKITWLMGSVPNENRGSFTAVKEMISLAGGIVVSLGFGAIADIFRDEAGMPTKPYYVICTAAMMVMMIIHTVTLLVSEEKPEPAVSVPIRKTVGRMIHNRDLIKVISVGIIWNIVSALSVSFFVSYLRQELAFSFTIIAVLSTAASICRIAVSPLLGRIADRYSFATSMTLSFAVVAVGFLAMVFTVPETRWLYLVYACLNAFAMAGINGGLINLIYDYVGNSERGVAMGVQNALGGILGFLATLVSGFILGKVQQAGGLYILGTKLYAQQLLAFMSFVGTVILIVYMRAVIAPLHKAESRENIGNDGTNKEDCKAEKSCVKEKIN